MKARPKMGRPTRAGKAATERIEIRVTTLELAAWKHAAAITEMSLSAWIRACCAVEVEALQKTGQMK